MAPGDRADDSRKLVLVTRRTRLEDLVARYNTVGQARFYVEHLGADFGLYLSEHETYVRQRAETEAELRRLGRVQAVDRGFLPNFLFGAQDTVVVLGQDGLVANTLKYLDAQPVVGVNPDPSRFDGRLLPFRVDELGDVVTELWQGRRGVRRVAMAKACLPGGQVLHAVNDLFIGHRTHQSARYAIRLGSEAESQSSSGIIVSTGLGSTGWLRSCLTGARAIALARGLETEEPRPVPWDAPFLHYTVREPFPSRSTGTRLVFGRIEAGALLQVTSHMAESGVIFSDGIEADALEFSAGLTAEISLAEKAGHLVA